MNKKRLSFILFIFGIALFAALNTTIQTNEYGLNEISLDNVEALAQEGSTSGCKPVKGGCFKNGIKVNHASIK